MSSTRCNLTLQGGMKLKPLPIFQQLLLVVLLATLSLHSSAFGTLLTSPGQRALLDNERQNNELRSLPASGEKTVVHSENISLEGLVMRQKGPVTIWLNGQLLDRDAIGLPPQSHAEGAMAVTLPSKQGRVLLKPGQQIGQVNGELSDAYQ